MAVARVRPTMPAFAAELPAVRAIGTIGPLTDATLTMRPYRLCCMQGNTARVILNVVDRLIARSWCHWSSAIASIRSGISAWPNRASPAVLIRISTPPIVARTCARTAWACSASVRSPTRARCPLPKADKASRRSKIRAVFEVIATRAPAAASAIAMAKPIPPALPAPVTKALRPLTPAMTNPIAAARPTRAKDAARSSEIA